MSPANVLRLVAACSAASLAWITCEVAGGLAFLACGLRLWRYEIVPVLFDITSPVVWLLALVLIAPLTLGFDRWLRIDRLAPRWQMALRLAFLMVTGPVVEVVLNRFLFEAAFGKPLYRYTFLPTFDGSGSLLSPLYYATLYLHRPVVEVLYPSGARRSSSPEATRRRAASRSPAA